MVMVMVMNDLLPPLSSISIGPHILRCSYFKIWPWQSLVKAMSVVMSRSHLTLRIQGQGHSQGQTWWLHLMAKFQSICLLFVSWRWDYVWLRCSKFHIWPWKSKVKKTNQVTNRSRKTIEPKMKEIQKVAQKLSREQELAAGFGVRTGTKTKSRPRYTGAT